MKYGIIFFIAMFFMQCRSKNYQDDFYSGYAISDLYRLPLLKPYELLNQAKASPDYPPTHGWNLRFLYKNFDGYISHVNVSHVNVFHGIIYGHGKDGQTSFPNAWFVIIPQQKAELIFKTEKEWVVFLQSKRINAGNLYSVWSVFDKFKEQDQLPWGKE